MVGDVEGPRALRNGLPIIESRRAVGIDEPIAGMRVSVQQAEWAIRARSARWTQKALSIRSGFRMTAGTSAQRSVAKNLAITSGPFARGHAELSSSARIGKPIRGFVSRNSLSQ